jgi:hypothetical protein
MKEFTTKIDKGMVVPADSGRIAEAIIKYLDKSEKEKSSLSARSRSLASFFNEKDMVALFRKELAKLENRI